MTRVGNCAGGRRAGLSGSSGVSERVQMLRAPPANDADNWPPDLSTDMDECENELEKSAEDDGGRSGECAITEPLLRDWPVAIARALKDDDSGEGRLGDEANCAVEPDAGRLNPAEGDPAAIAAGGP